MDDLLLDGLEGPSALLIIAFALYVSIRLSELPEAYLGYVEKGLYLSLILTVTMGLANISGRIIAFVLKKADLPISVTSLLHAVTKAMVYAIGALTVLNFLGVSMTPIITAPLASAVLPWPLPWPLLSRTPSPISLPASIFSPNTPYG